MASQGDTADDDFRAYLNEVAGRPLLSLDEEQRLGRDILAGRDAQTRLDVSQLILPATERVRLHGLVRRAADAHAELVDANLRLVVALARKYLAQGSSIEVLVGAGNVGLVRAAERHRRDRRRVPERHLIDVGLLRCTDGLLTLLDLACVLDEIRWEWALEAALHERLTTIAQIESTLAAPGRGDPAGRAVIESVLAVRPLGAPATHSLLETRFLELARKHGLPEPTRQHPVEITPGRHYYIDIAWPELGFFIELNGKDHEKQQLHDADRLAAIVARTGWTYIILTWDQVVRTPSYTARRVAKLLEAFGPAA